MLASSKKIIIIGNDAAAVYQSKGKQISRLAYVVWDDEAFDRKFLVAVNHGKKGEPITILFDMIEQQYKKEIIPKVNFMDKKKVIHRKLMMAFPNNPVHASLELKRPPKDGAGKLYLFTSIPPCSELDRVVDLLKDTTSAIKGFYLLPLEGGALADYMGEVLFKSVRDGSSQWTVLVTYNRTGGLRQVVVRDGELALTRLTPLGSGQTQNPNLANEIVKEFNATLTYLARFGYQATDGLDLIAVCSPDDANRLQNANLPVSNMATPTPAEAIRLVGMKIFQGGGDEDNNSAGILHAAWTMAAKKKIMPLEMKAIDSIRKPRLIASLLGTVLMFGMLGLLGVGGYIFQENMILKGDLAVKQTMQNALRNEHREASKILDVLEFEPERVKGFLEIYDTLEKRKFDPSPILNAINQSLAGIRLDALEVIGPEEDKSDQNAYQKEIAKVGDTVTINMTIEFPENQDPETGVYETEDFVRRLQANFPGHKVDVVEMVGDLTVEGSVQGVSSLDADEAAQQSRTTTSVIRIKGPAL